MERTSEPQQSPSPGCLHQILMQWAGNTYLTPDLVYNNTPLRVQRTSPQQSQHCMWWQEQLYLETHHPARPGGELFYCRVPDVAPVSGWVEVRPQKKEGFPYSPLDRRRFPLALNRGALFNDVSQRYKRHRCFHLEAKVRSQPLPKRRTLNHTPKKRRCDLTAINPQHSIDSPAIQMDPSQG